MHELAVTQGIVDLVTRVGRREGLHSVTRVVVEVGVAAAVVPDAMTFCFDIVAAHTIAHGAKLVIERVVPRAARAAPNSSRRALYRPARIAAHMGPDCLAGVSCA